MALVGVEDLRLGCSGEARPQPQGTHTTDAEEHLLLEPLLTPAAVEALGDRAHRVVVAGDVGVEQEQRHAADLGAPHVRAQLSAPGHRDADDARGAVRLAQQVQRQPLRVGDGIGLLLPAVGVEALLEVAGLVEETDADDRHAEVGRRLEVVAGEDAEATGVLRQHGGDAVLGAEVGDRSGGVTLRALLLEPPRGGQVGVEVGLGGGDARDEVGVRGQRVELARREGGEHANRIVVHGVPPLGVDAGEESAGRRVPAPAQVHGQVAEGGDRLGEGSSDTETSDGLHPGHLCASEPLWPSPHRRPPPLGSAPRGG